MCACKHRVSGSFHSPPGVLFTFPSQYFSTIGHQVVFRLGGWSPRLPCGFLVPARTLDSDRRFPVSTTRLSLSPAGFPTPFVYRFTCLRLSLTPDVFLLPVWPLPFSLAATLGISVDFFSSGYLDVSVPRVPLSGLWIPPEIRGSSPRGFPHSDICGSTLICSSPQLFAACRVLLRLLMPRHSPCALFCLNFPLCFLRLSFVQNRVKKLHLAVKLSFTLDGKTRISHF